MNSTNVQLLKLSYIALFLTLSLAARRVVDARSLSRIAGLTMRADEASPLSLQEKYDYVFDNKSVDRGLNVKDDDDEDDDDDDDEEEEKEEEEDAGDRKSYNRGNSNRRELRQSKRSDANQRSDPQSILYADEHRPEEHEGPRVFHTGPFEEIECPLSTEGRRRLFPCVTPDQFGFYVCIDDHALCDNVRQCPNGEDENGTVCMFHRMTLNYFKILMTAMFGLSKSVV